MHLVPYIALRVLQAGVGVVLAALGLEFARFIFRQLRGGSSLYDAFDYERHRANVLDTLVWLGLLYVACEVAATLIATRRARADAPAFPVVPREMRKPRDPLV